MKALFNFIMEETMTEPARKQNPAPVPPVPATSMRALTTPANADVVTTQQSLLNVVGLFGTCGDSKWRDAPIEKLRKASIESFNPVVPNWTPECAEIEAKNLKLDKALLFVVTGETESYGSLAEIGWAELSTRESGRKAFFVIEDFKEVDGSVNPKHAANRTRKLVKAHAKEHGVTIYGSVDEALAVVTEYMKN